MQQWKVGHVAGVSQQRLLKLLRFCSPHAFTH
jgi:hypothetical protein